MRKEKAQGAGHGVRVAAHGGLRTKGASEGFKERRAVTTGVRGIEFVAGGPRDFARGPSAEAQISPHGWRFSTTRTL